MLVSLNILDVLVLLDLTKPSHSIAKGLAHSVLVFVGLSKRFLTSGAVLLGSLRVGEVDTWRVENISLNAIVSSDRFGYGCRDRVLVHARTVASRMGLSIAPNTLRLEFALDSDVTGLTAVLAHKVPTAAVPEIDDCTSFLGESNEVVQGLLKGSLLARTNHELAKTSTSRSDIHARGVVDEPLLYGAHQVEDDDTRFMTG